MFSGCSLFGRWPPDEKFARTLLTIFRPLKRSEEWDDPDLICPAQPSQRLSQQVSQQPVSQQPQPQAMMDHDDYDQSDEDEPRGGLQDAVPSAGEGIQQKGPFALAILRWMETSDAKTSTNKT